VSAIRASVVNAWAALTATLAITGCNSTGSVTRPAAPALVASDRALALPPPGGPAVVGVIERPRGNGVEQNITLATTARVPGENFMRVEFFGPQTGQAPTIPFRTITETGVRREAAAAIPGVPLTRRMTYLQNSYGPFAYAAGRSISGDTCLYAWQQLRARTASSGIGRDFGMIQVRWRLCDAHASEQQLLSAVYGSTIVGTFSGSQWNPFGEPNPVDSRIGLTAHPIHPGPAASASAIPMGYAGGVDLSPRSSAAQNEGSLSPQRVQPSKPSERITPVPRVPSPDELAPEQMRVSPAAAARSQQPIAVVTVPSPDSILLQNPN